MKMSGIIFSNIYDNAMGELTMHRTAASMPFGGRYRFIDFVLSNMVNSGVNNIGVITKYNYQSLMDHLGGGSEWDLNRKNASLFILPPFGTGVTNVYRGNLEALSNAVTFLNTTKPDYVLMCDTTVICNIDYDLALQAHVESGADVTVIANSAIKTYECDSSDLVITADEQGKVKDISWTTSHSLVWVCLSSAERPLSILSTTMYQEADTASRRTIFSPVSTKAVSASMLIASTELYCVTIIPCPTSKTTSS